MKRFLVFVITILMAMALLFNGSVAVKGAIEGISLCANIVIPSTFAFMVIGCFIPLSGFAKWIVFPFRPITRYLLRLPDELGAALLMSFIGGYPAGVKTISTMCDYGIISTDTASRICYFAINPSPAFVITAVGQLMWGNAKIGIIFYVSQIISCLIMGFVFRPKYRNFSVDPATVLAPEQAFVLAVGNASGAMVTICGFIVFFAVVSALIAYYGQVLELPSWLLVGISGFLEVTGGCKAATTLGNPIGLLLSSFLISYGGLSIAYQNLSIASGSKIQLPHFVKIRLLNGVLSTVITYFLLEIFPITTTVMRVSTKPRIVYSSNQGVGTVCLLAMAILTFNIMEKAQGFFYNRARNQR